MKCAAVLSIVFFSVCTLVVADDPKAGSDPDVTVLYGGGDLSGWAGRKDLWSAEDGEIVGRTSDENPIDGNTFLVWQGGQPNRSNRRRRTTR